MAQEAKSWDEMTAMMRGLLVRATGEDVDAWNAKIAAQKGLKDKERLKTWLTKQGVTGYAQMLMVYETFGYPEFFTKSADELIEGQYADRPTLRPILDAILEAAEALDDVTVQSRKGYVSLVAKRQFAIIRATTKTRVDLGLRWESAKPMGRLEVSKGLGNETINVKFGLARAEDVDAEVKKALRQAWEENR